MTDVTDLAIHLENGAVESWRDVKNIKSIEMGEAGSTIAKGFWQGNINKSIAKEVDERTRDIDATDKYSPFLYDLLLGDVSALLDRCLAYRTEASELEIRHVAAALEIQLFEERSASDKKLYKKQSKSELYTSIAEAIRGSDKTANMDSEAIKAALKSLAVTENEIESLKNAKRMAAEAGSKLLAKRYDDEGGSHNFKERYETSLLFLVEDCVEAYLKAESAVVGLTRILKIKKDDCAVPEPRKHGPRFLDEFVNWTRRMMRFLEEQSQWEADTTVSIPLTKKWFKEEKGIFERADILKFFDEVKPLPFVVDGKYFDGMKSPRVRGLSLTFVNDRKEPAFYLDHSWFECEVSTPDLRLGAGKQVSRPNLRVQVGSAFGNASSYQGGSAVRNLPPEGEWQLKRKSNLVGHTGGVDPKHVEDIVLHLDVRYIADYGFTEPTRPEPPTLEG